MRVENMVSSRGNTIPNQFIIDDNENMITYFQSYKSIIVKQPMDSFRGTRKTELDQRYWNYSKTTSKYRALFLGESTKETQAKIDSGEYVLTNLNGGK